MRVSRIRKMRILRKKKKRLIYSFFIILPLASIIIGYMITDLVILPMYYN